MFRLNFKKAFNSLFVFLFIFSIFNDNFLVDHLGENALKGIFLVFILVNIPKLYRNAMNWKMLGEQKWFFVFLALNYFVMIFNPGNGDRLFENSLLIISMLVVVVFFIDYDLKLLLYMNWFTLMVSALICFFNSPISEWTFRKTGGTGDPNEFAAEMLSFLFLSVYLYTQNKNLIFIILSSLGFLYSIMFAASMSSFLVLGIMALLILIRYMSMSFTKSLVATSMSLMVAILLLMIFQEKLESTETVSNLLGRTEQTGTAFTRFNSWKAGLNMFVDKPLMGVGMRMYAENSPKYSSVYLSEDSVAPHNLFIELIAECGIIIFLAFMIFLYDLMSKYFRIIVHTKYFWLYMSLVAYLLMGLTLGVTYNKFLWLSIAMLMNIQHLLHMEALEEPRRKPEFIDIGQQGPQTLKNKIAQNSGNLKQLR
ncbi:MAG: O-antigen ligase family protein [Ignavibacteriales bacterium]